MFDSYLNLDPAQPTAFADEKALAPSVIVKIAPAYQKAMAVSEIFSQDLEEMTGGVR